MLTNNPDLMFLVCPAWASYEQLWSQLVQRSNPVSCDEVVKWLESNRANGTINEHVLASCKPGISPGAFGGGVYCLTSKYEEVNRPLDNIAKDVHIISPPGLALFNDFSCNVYYFEPRIRKSLASWTSVGRASVACGTTFEHLETTGNECYWLLALDGECETDRIADCVVRSGRYFGLSADFLEVPSNEVVEKLNPIILNSKHRFLVFPIGLSFPLLGLQYAFLVYTAYYVKTQFPKNVVSMHLCCSIQGKPNIRRLWSQR
jgi:hypothetical protein